MRNNKWVMIIVVVVTVSIFYCCMKPNIHCVQAEGPAVIYTYDSLGRVKTVTYPDEVVITYIYDKNGNIKEVQKKPIEATTEKPDDTGKEEMTTEKSDDTGKEEMTTENSSGAGMEDVTTEKASGSETTEAVKNDNLLEEKESTSTVRLTAKDVKAYNQFKKRKPVIKSLKQSKKKNKRYLKIQIKKVSNTGKYPETGYQIKYATNKKFKKAKSITITRNRKKSITGQKWKVKQKKTYYVKIRAFMKTKTGKKIYTKYSKVKKIKVK